MDRADAEAIIEAGKEAVLVTLRQRKRSPAPHLRPISPPHITPGRDRLVGLLARIGKRRLRGALVNVYIMQVMRAKQHLGERL